MEAIQLGLRALGGFYAFAGILIMRAVVMDHLMDQMLAGITLEPIPRKEHLRRWLMGITGVVTGMAGAALLILSLWSVPLFVSGTLIQMGYLAWARQAFIPEDELDIQGRRQTINAALLYGAATIGVITAAAYGFLRDWRDPWAVVIPVAGLGLSIFIGRHFLWKARRRDHWPEPVEDDDWPEDKPIPPLTRVRLEPTWGSWGLFDAETGEDRQPDLYMPRELADRIHNWQYAFRPAQDGSARLDAEFEDAQHEAEHRKAGDAIRDDLIGIFGAGNVEGPVYPKRIFYVGPVAALPRDEN